jgi:hypothetical protein
MSKTKTNQSRLNYHSTQMENLAKLDLAAQAWTLGLKVDSRGQVLVDFLGHKLAVDHQGVHSLDERAVSLDMQSVVAHYLCSRGQGDLIGEFVPIGRLTGINVTMGSPSENLAKPLIDKIGPRYDLFSQAAKKIEGRHNGLTPAGGQAWDFGLPKLIIRIEFFEEDEEFPAEIKLLFDLSANRFADYACLELFTMCLVVELLMTAGLISDPSECENSFI